ncbi:Srebp Regulating Protein [Manis pentadactyla]|nr:Srebp Regulating Protein [Manis pentadactyla]
MVNLAAMVWRRLLRKRWVLALVFGLSLVYFLTSTFKQVQRLTGACVSRFILAAALGGGGLRVAGGKPRLREARGRFEAPAGVPGVCAFTGSVLYRGDSSKTHEEERAVRDRNLLQVQDHDQPIPWKVQFNLGNSSRLGNRCRNSIQGKRLITDELGYVCERKDLLVNGCCNINVPSTKQYRCDGCLSNGCCGTYEYCVSCCLQPNKQLLLERFLSRAAVAFQNLFMAVEDHFELCLAKCRTSSQSVQHENTYRDPIAKYCYGESPPELFPA